jgi:hypothetical protein
VFVLTHEGASVAERAPYLGALWDPVPVTAVYGRYSRADPPCPPRTAVHYAWRDVLLPIMQDPAFPQDVLFFVAEEDWRLREQDGHHVSQQGLEAGPPDPSRCKTSREPSAVQGAVRGPTPRSLADLVGAATQAARAGYGDLLWLSYLLQNDRYENAAPSYGSTLIALTQKTAQVLARWMQADGKGAVQHFDVWLKRRLSEDAKAGRRRELWTSFAAPCYGCYVQRQSACQPDIGDRQPCWQEAWVQEGTRKEESVVKVGRDRQLRHLGPWWTNRVVVPTVAYSTDAKCWWRTHAESQLAKSHLVPAFFKYGVPEAKPHLWSQVWPGMSFLWRASATAPGVQTIGEPSAAEGTGAAGSRKRKRGVVQRFAFDDPEELPEVPCQPLTQRQQRQRRLVRGTFFQRRLWVCHEAAMPNESFE